MASPHSSPRSRTRNASPEADADTRSRLLKAAAEVFSECGFEAATIRQICARAGANVALVNYHFGDKLELYTQVLRSALHAGHCESQQDAPKADPESALRSMVRMMLDRAVETGNESSLVYRLMMLEVVRPTSASSRIVEVVIRPVYERLLEITAAILGLPADDDQTRLCVHSILGQVAHFAQYGSRESTLWPRMKMTAEQRELVAAHIADSTLAYLRVLANPLAP